MIGEITVSCASIFPTSELCTQLQGIQDPSLWRKIKPVLKELIEPQNIRVEGILDNISFYWAFTMCQRLGFPGGSVVKNPPTNVGDTSLGQEVSPGERNGNQLQCSCLGNLLDRGTCGLQVRGARKSQTWLSMHSSMCQTCTKYFTCTVSFYFYHNSFRQVHITSYPTDKGLRHST